MANFLTIHQLVTIPWSNLNRDDSGTPKRLFQGGVLRGQLSSQSIKRAARGLYENESQNISIRSAHLDDVMAKRVQELNPGISEEDAKENSRKAIKSLTNKDEKEKTSAKNKKEKTSDKDTSIWLSAEEIEAAAKVIADGDSEIKQVLGAGQCGALSVAAFGRMFANAAGQNVEAAIAVSPAVSTHEAIIETDYFTTVDDYPSEKQKAGATYLGLSLFTNGVFYRSTTIDREQLRRAWSGIDGEAAREQLSAMVEALIYALPKGKKNSTAPYVMPEVLLAEEQKHRIAYEFEKPVQPDRESGGFMRPSIERLVAQVKAARRFDDGNFGDLQIVSGTSEDLDGFEMPYRDKSEFIKEIVDWILP